MNHLCYVCQSPAKLVCKHQDCDLPPFICDGPCIRGIGQLTHTHNKQKQFVKIDEYYQKVEAIKYQLDSENIHKQYFQDIQKKTKIVKQYITNYLKTLIQNIDELLESHKNDIKVKLTLQLKKQIQIIMKKIDEDLKRVSLQGNDIYMLIEQQQLYQNQTITQRIIDSLKKDFAKQLKKLENYKIDFNYMVYQQRIKNTQILLDQSRQLISKKDWTKALETLQSAQQFNDFDQEIYFNIGECYQNMNKLDQAKKNYCKSLQLNQDNVTLNRLANICYRNKRYKQSIKYCSTALNIYFQDSQPLTTRGKCYIQMKRYQDANIDLSKAIKSDPSEQIAELILQVSKKLQSSIKQPMKYARPIK